MDKTADTQTNDNERGKQTNRPILHRQTDL